MRKDESDDESRVFSSCEAQIEVDSSSSTSDEFPPENRPTSAYLTRRSARLSFCPSFLLEGIGKMVGFEKEKRPRTLEGVSSIEFWEDYFNSVEESDFSRAESRDGGQTSTGL